MGTDVGTKLQHFFTTAARILLLKCSLNQVTERLNVNGIKMFSTTFYDKAVLYRYQRVC